MQYYESSITMRAELNRIHIEHCVVHGLQFGYLNSATIYFKLIDNEKKSVK